MKKVYLLILLTTLYCDKNRFEKVQNHLSMLNNLTEENLCSTSKTFSLDRKLKGSFLGKEFIPKFTRLLRFKARNEVRIEAIIPANLTVKLPCDPIEFLAKYVFVLKGDSVEELEKQLLTGVDLEQKKLPLLSSYMAYREKSGMQKVIRLQNTGMIQFSKDGTRKISSCNNFSSFKKSCQVSSVPNYTVSIQLCSQKSLASWLAGASFTYVCEI